MQLQKDMKSNLKQPSCKKVCSPEEGHFEKKIFEIHDKVAAMMVG